jgi:hypothetical protein
MKPKSENSSEQLLVKYELLSFVAASVDNSGRLLRYIFETAAPNKKTDDVGREVQRRLLAQVDRLSKDLEDEKHHARETYRKELQKQTKKAKS